MGQSSVPASDVPLAGEVGTKEDEGAAKAETTKEVGLSDKQSSPLV
jgi:hypothetical protein